MHRKGGSATDGRAYGPFAREAEDAEKQIQEQQTFIDSLRDSVRPWQPDCEAPTAADPSSLSCSRVECASSSNTSTDLHGAQSVMQWTEAERGRAK